MYLDIFHYMLTTALCNAQNTIIWNRILILVFIGPRYAWGPIYGSECLQMSDSKTLLKQVMQVMQVLQVMQGICKLCKKCASYARNMPVLQFMQVICKLCKECASHASNMQVLQFMQVICKFCKQIMLIEHSKAMLQCKCPNARGAIFYVVLYPQGKNPPLIVV